MATLYSSPKTKENIIITSQGPPVINQFTKTIEKNQATTLLKLLRNYQPETKQKKAERLKAEAESKS